MNHFALFLAVNPAWATDLIHIPNPMLFGIMEFGPHFCNGLTASQSLVSCKFLCKGGSVCTRNESQMALYEKCWFHSIFLLWVIWAIMYFKWPLHPQMLSKFSCEICVLINEYHQIKCRSFWLLPKWVLPIKTHQFSLDVAFAHQFICQIIIFVKL